ncbi:hypothetical protein D3C76_89620 [compost metagenome]
MSTNTSLQAIIDAVKANDFVVIDDHSRDGGTSKVQGVGIHTRDDQVHVVALYKDYAYYSVNNIYLDSNGVPHLSKWSVGGAIEPCGDLDYGVEVYNNRKGVITMPKITDVVKAS